MSKTLPGCRLPEPWELLLALGSLENALEEKARCCKALRSSASSGSSCPSLAGSTCALYRAA